jgi:hypothetical protein
MATNLPDTKTTTEQIFNGYYTQQVTYNPEVYNQILAFFISRSESESAAKQLTQSVMALTYNNNLDPLTVLKDFGSAASTNEFKLLLLTFFNTLRGPTSKIGYANDTFKNQWVERNILP